jgi:Arc/MetJ-type ribon-helix-helix transcriptional regulator
MARPETEHWSVPIPSDFAAELEAAMKDEGFNSKAEFARAALREKLERSARRRLELALLEGVQSGTSNETTEALFKRLRKTLPPRKKRAARGR